MRYYEFTKPSDYTLLEDEINDVLRQLEQIWKSFVMRQRAERA